MNAAEPLILSLSRESAERSERTGTRREHTFEACDGSIGRADDCDWMLCADGVSRLHAFVRHLNGLYFVEDRSTNGMLINGAPMRKGDPAALKHGDRLQIDTFEIEVCLRAREQTDWGDMTRVMTPVPVQPPQQAGGFDAGARRTAQPDYVANAEGRTDAGAVARNPLPSGALAVTNEAEDHESLIPGAAHGAMPGMSLDPLALFDAPPSYLDTPWPCDPPSPAWNHTPVVSDRFRPPAPEADRAHASMLPDDWNATHIEAHRQPAMQPQVEREIPPPMQPATQPHADMQAESPCASAAGPALEAPRPSSSEPDHQGRSPEHRPDAAVAPSGAAPTSGHASMPVPIPAPMPMPAPTASADPRHDDLLPLLIVAVDAMMDVLRARAELKNSFRLPATLIQRSENNPLKFAPNAQDAVAKLLAASDGGFLSGRAALDDAADDIRNHQMAMLAGVRSAFDSLLAQFDPARIEEQTESNTRRLSLGTRPRHWERYKAQFEALTRNPDECFRRLFGDEFARAYEAQLSRLKTRRD